jgi:hypothetical protein
MTYREAAQWALDCQDACNLSGVAHSFDKAVSAVFQEKERLGKGTAWVNRHPIITMYLLKMAELNGCGSSLDPSYSPAEQACKEIAACSGNGGCIHCNTPENAVGKY